MRVEVYGNDINGALRVLKKKLHREGLFRELRNREAFESASDRRMRKREESKRRARHMARREAILAGELPRPRRKPEEPRQGETLPIHHPSRHRPLWARGQAA